MSFVADPLVLVSPKALVVEALVGSEIVELLLGSGIPIALTSQIDFLPVGVNGRPSVVDVLATVDSRLPNVFMITALKSSALHS